MQQQQVPALFSGTMPYLVQPAEPGTNPFLPGSPNTAAANDASGLIMQQQQPGLLGVPALFSGTLPYLVQPAQPGRNAILLGGSPNVGSAGNDANIDIQEIEDIEEIEEID